MARIKIQRALIIILLLLLGIGLSACSFYFPRPKPQEGIWYCEELMIEIDFSVLNVNENVNPPYFVKKYNSDGSYQEIMCYFDYGSGIELCSMDGEKHYFIGRFKYLNGVFLVTTIDNKYTYVFERLD